MKNTICMFSYKLLNEFDCKDIGLLRRFLYRNNPAHSRLIGTWLAIKNIVDPSNKWVNFCLEIFILEKFPLLRLNFKFCKFITQTLKKIIYDCVSFSMDKSINKDVSLELFIMFSELNGLLIYLDSLFISKTNKYEIYELDFISSVFEEYFLFKKYIGIKDFSLRGYLEDTSYLQKRIFELLINERLIRERNFKLQTSGFGVTDECQKQITKELLQVKIFNCENDEVERRRKQSLWKSYFTKEESQKDPFNPIYEQKLRDILINPDQNPVFLEYLKDKEKNNNPFGENK